MEKIEDKIQYYSFFFQLCKMDEGDFILLNLGLVTVVFTSYMVWMLAAPIIGSGNLGVLCCIAALISIPLLPSAYQLVRGDRQIEANQTNSTTKEKKN